jgi:hypothetical protein
LGEFFLASFLGVITEVAQICRANFLHAKSCVFILTQKDWATFWAAFSQTNLVTLIWTKLFRLHFYQQNKRRKKIGAFDIFASKNSHHRHI